LQEFLHPALNLVLPALQRCDLGARRFQHPHLLRLRREDLTVAFEPVKLGRERLELRLKELACGSVACRLELRLKVLLRPRQLGVEQPLVLLLTLTREQPSDLIAGPCEPPPIDAEGARGVALRDRQFLNVREHVAAVALDVRKGGFKTL
jgi:hypothetical protein